MKISVADLYREIGRTFREHGAERVALLSSKTCSDVETEIELEVAVDGMINEKELYQSSRNQWPYVQMKILNLNEEHNIHLIDEVIEDSILL